LLTTEEVRKFLLIFTRIGRTQESDYRLCAQRVRIRAGILKK